MKMKYKSGFCAVLLALSVCINARADLGPGDPQSPVRGTSTQTAPTTTTSTTSTSTSSPESLLPPWAYAVYSAFTSINSMF